MGNGLAMSTIHPCTLDEEENDRIWAEGQVFELLRYMWNLLESVACSVTPSYLGPSAHEDLFVRDDGSRSCDTLLTQKPFLSSHQVGDPLVLGSEGA